MEVTALLDVTEANEFTNDRLVEESNSCVNITSFGSNNSQVIQTNDVSNLESTSSLISGVHNTTINSIKAPFSGTIRNQAMKTHRTIVDENKNRTFDPRAKSRASFRDKYRRLVRVNLNSTDIGIPISNVTSSIETTNNASNTSLPSSKIEERKIQVQSKFSSADVPSLLAKYPKKIVKCNIHGYPNCDVFLCGTLHISKSSVSMVQEAIQTLKPHYIVLELCEDRVESVYEPIDLEHPQDMTIRDVIRALYADKSIKTFGVGLLVW